MVAPVRSDYGGTVILAPRGWRTIERTNAASAREPSAPLAYGRATSGTDMGSLVQRFGVGNAPANSPLVMSSSAVAPLAGDRRPSSTPSEAKSRLLKSMQATVNQRALRKHRRLSPPASGIGFGPGRAKPSSR